MKDSFHDHRLDPKHPRNQFQGEPSISDQITREGLSVVWRNLEKILEAHIPGDVVEFGCYAGTTSLFIRRLLNQAEATKNTPVERAFHVYDSFEGLPEKTPPDANAAGVDFEAGKLYVSKKEFLQVFKNAGLRPSVIHKGWFNALQATDVPEHIAFAFLDGDFYDSIISSLRLVYPRMSEGGIILIDDYKRETLPGVERAIADYFQKQPAIIRNLRAEANIAIIQL